MNIYEELDANEIIDAVSFFPELAANRTIQGKLTPDITKSIEEESTDIWNKDKSEVLSLLIDRYFDLDAYHSVDQINLLGWATQFIIRKKIIDQLTSQNPAASHLQYSKYNLQDSIFQLINEPVIDLKRRPFMFLGHFTSINDLTVSELQTIAENYIDDGTFEFLEKNSDLVVDADKDIIIEDEEKLLIDPDDVFNLLISPVNDTLAHGSEPRITATINLNINDTQLIKDFADYLSRKRQELNVQPLSPKPFKRAKIQSLIDNRVLQYLDLKILDLYINGKETLEQRVLADYIFPDTELEYSNVNVIEKIRKSTMRYADEMMNKDVIASIIAESKKLYSGDL